MNLPGWGRQEPNRQTVRRISEIGVFPAGEGGVRAACAGAKGIQGKSS